MSEQLAQRVEAPVIESVAISSPKETDGTITPECTESLLETGYLKDYFKLGESAGHFQMPQLIEEIDNFILSEIDRLGLEGRKGYEEIIQGYLDKLGLPDDVNDYIKVEKIASLVRINRKLVEALKEKEELMRKDPTSMTSSQLRKYIEENDRRNKKI